MYGFAYAVTDENHVLVKPFWEEELEEVWGTIEQIGDIRIALERRNPGVEETMVIVTFNEEELELEAEQKGAFYGTMAG